MLISFKDHAHFRIEKKKTISVIIVTNPEKYASCFFLVIMDKGGVAILPTLFSLSNIFAVCSPKKEKKKEDYELTQLPILLLLIDLLFDYLEFLQLLCFEHCLPNSN